MSTMSSVSIIQPRSGWQVVSFRELLDCRDLFYFLVRRDIKSVYAQTILGFSWAILQPLIQILVFSCVFGRVANIPTDGIPYLLFSTVAIVPWTYIAQAMTESSQSLIAGQHMLSKIYFPRLVFPLISVFAKLVDFGISLLIIAGVVIYYRVMPTWNLLLLPPLVILMMCLVAGVGMWMSAMAIRFRDVGHAMSFVIRMLVYTAPIVYSASSIPRKYRLIYSLNPIVGIIEGFRASILGLPITWSYVMPGTIISVLIFISGAYYFRRMERVFVDVI